MASRYGLSWLYCYSGTQESSLRWSFMETRGTREMTCTEEDWLMRYCMTIKTFFSSTCRGEEISFILSIWIILITWFNSQTYHFILLHGPPWVLINWGVIDVFLLFAMVTRGLMGCFFLLWQRPEDDEATQLGREWNRTFIECKTQGYIGVVDSQIRHVRQLPDLAAAQYRNNPKPRGSARHESARITKHNNLNTKRQTRFRKTIFTEWRGLHSALVQDL